MVDEENEMKQLGKTLKETLELDISDSIKTVMKTGFGPEDEGQTHEWMYGGNPYLVESLEDLAEVKSYYNSFGGISLKDYECSFDICEWLPCKEIVMVVYMTNNAGGDAFFIPKEFVTENVLKSIELNKRTF